MFTVIVIGLHSHSLFLVLITICKLGFPHHWALLPPTCFLSMYIDTGVLVDPWIRSITPQVSPVLVVCQVFMTVSHLQPLGCQLALGASVAMPRHCFNLPHWGHRAPDHPPSAENTLAGLVGWLIQYRGGLGCSPPRVHRPRTPDPTALVFSGCGGLVCSFPWSPFHSVLCLPCLLLHHTLCLYHSVHMFNTFTHIYFVVDVCVCQVWLFLRNVAAHCGSSETSMKFPFLHFSLFAASSRENSNCPFFPFCSLLWWKF